MIYVKGYLKFYDEHMRPLHNVKFDLKKENDLRKLINIIELKD